MKTVSAWNDSLHAVIGQRMMVLPGTGYPVDIEREFTVGQFQRYTFLADIGIVEVELERLVELLDGDHQFARCFEF